MKALTKVQVTLDTELTSEVRCMALATIRLLCV